MTISLKKTPFGAVAALAVGLAFALPAAAQPMPPGGPGPGPGPGMGPGIAAGILGGMALGAAAAGAGGPVYAAPPPGGCWIERRPVYDAYGNFIGRRRVRVCE